MCKAACKGEGGTYPHQRKYLSRTHTIRYIMCVIMRKRSLTRSILPLLTDYYIIYTRGTSREPEGTLRSHQPLLACSLHYGTLLRSIGGGVGRADAAVEGRERERVRRGRGGAPSLAAAKNILLAEGGASSSQKLPSEPLVFSSIFWG